VKSRLHLLWLVRDGKQVKEAAFLVGVHVRTGQQWLAWYREGGLPKVVQQKRGGKGTLPRLDAVGQHKLLEHLSEQGASTALELCKWVEEQFGVVYTDKGMYGLLARLKVKKKVPRPMNVKADAGMQEAYKKGA
jgi:transposase